MKTHQAVICVVFWYICYIFLLKLYWKRRVRESDVCNFLLKGSTDINRLDGWMGEWNKHGDLIVEYKDLVLSNTVIYLSICFSFFGGWGMLCHMACGVLVSWPGVEPAPLAVKARSPTCWTARAVPRILMIELGWPASVTEKLETRKTDKREKEESYLSNCDNQEEKCLHTYQHCL